MSRTSRLRIVCAVMATLCLLAGVLRLGAAVVPLADPIWTTNTLLCQGVRCRLLADPLRLLGPVQAIEARRIPDAAAKLTARSRLPGVRGMLFASKLARALPDFLMYASLALALRCFASGDPFGLQAVRWLRRGAAAAFASVLAQPVATSLRNTALEPALTGVGGLHFSVAGDEVVVGLFLAGVVWVAAWALEEGRRTQAELAQFV